MTIEQMQHCVHFMRSKIATKPRLIRSQRLSEADWKECGDRHVGKFAIVRSARFFRETMSNVLQDPEKCKRLLSPWKLRIDQLKECLRMYNASNTIRNWFIVQVIVYIIS